MLRHGVKLVDAGLVAGVALTAAGGWTWFSQQGSVPSNAPRYDPLYSCDSSRRSESALFGAAASGDIQAMQELIAGGVAVDSLDDRFQRTPFGVAAAQGQAEAAKLLLRAGANVNHRDRHGITPLVLASWHGHKGAVLLLLQEGADKMAPDAFGVTALQKAAAFGHAEVVRVLVRTTENPEDVDRALRLSAMRGHHRVVSELLESGAVDLGACDEDGCGVLHHGCQDQRVVAALLQAGADPCSRCKGKLPWELCDDQALAQVLRKASESRSEGGNFGVRFVGGVVDMES
eukprot:TRINITY_DN54502_c0_g1_i1.p1 TRINITY_DN54502_c0_g1~~TRINITY_DN54502_c0_g1_i1.p1  ORF type:complete len:289 (+),score=72.41 TRINITY_DN54502_c0_g1_i1:174-1040(+)